MTNCSFGVKQQSFTHKLVDRYEISISQLAIFLFLFAYFFLIIYHWHHFYRTGLRVTLGVSC